MLENHLYGYLLSTPLNLPHQGPVRDDPVRGRVQDQCRGAGKECCFRGGTIGRDGFEAVGYSVSDGTWFTGGMELIYVVIYVDLWICIWIWLYVYTKCILLHYFEVLKKNKVYAILSLSPSPLNPRIATLLFSSTLLPIRSHPHHHHTSRSLLLKFPTLLTF